MIDYSEQRLRIDKANEFELDQIIQELKDDVSICETRKQLLEYALNKKDE